MFLYDCLKTPKSTVDLQFIFREHGLGWNEKQVELFAMLDPRIHSNEHGKWIVQQDERRQAILDAIDKAMGYRPMTKIAPDVVQNIPSKYIVPILEVKEVALSTGRYESPRYNILRIKR